MGRSCYRAIISRAATTSRGTMTVTKRERDRHHHHSCAFSVLTPAGQNTRDKKRSRRSQDEWGRKVQRRGHRSMWDLTLRPACTAGHKAGGARLQ